MSIDRKATLEAWLFWVFGQIYGLFGHATRRSISGLLTISKSCYFGIKVSFCIANKAIKKHFFGRELR